MKICWLVLGDVYVDCVEKMKIVFDELFQMLIMEVVWGYVWFWLGLMKCECLLIMIVLLVMFGYYDEVVMYICVIVNMGVMLDDFMEVMLYVVIYVGVFVVNYNIKIIKDVLEKMYLIVI